MGELRERLLEEEARRRELETNLVEKEREVEDLQFRVEEAEITSEGDHLSSPFPLSPNANLENNDNQNCLLSLFAKLSLILSRIMFTSYPLNLLTTQGKELRTLVGDSANSLVLGPDELIRAYRYTFIYTKILISSYRDDFD